MPSVFVVKNGSKMCSMTSGGMPLPVSATERRTYFPGARFPCVRQNSSSKTEFSVEIRRFPPEGIASRALTAMFRITCSI